MLLIQQYISSLSTSFASLIQWLPHDHTTLYEILRHPDRGGAEHFVISTEAEPSGEIRLRVKSKFRQNPDVSIGHDMTTQHTFVTRYQRSILVKATSFSEFLLEFLEVFGTFLPVFELLLERFALQLLHNLFSPLPLHANAIKGLRLHVRSPPMVSIWRYRCSHAICSRRCTLESSGN